MPRNELAGPNVARAHHGSRGRHRAALDGARPRCRIDHARRREADEPHSVSHLRELIGADEPFGRGAARQVHDDDVGLGVDPMEVADSLQWKLGETLLRDRRIAGQDFHAQGEGALRQERSARTDPDDTEGPAAHFGAGLRPHEGLPSAGAQVGMSVGQVVCTGKDQRQRLFRGGDEVALRRVDHDDAKCGRLRDVHIVDARARAAHDLELTAGAQHVGSDAVRRADDQAVAAGDPAEELGFVPAGAVLGLEAGGEKHLDGLSGKSLEDDHSLLVAHLMVPQ